MRLFYNLVNSMCLAQLALAKERYGNLDEEVKNAIRKWLTEIGIFFLTMGLENL